MLFGQTLLRLTLSTRLRKYVPLYLYYESFRCLFMRLQSSILNIIMCCNQVAAGKISIVIVPIPLFTKRKTISAHELQRSHQESVWHAYSFLRLLVISDLWTFNQTRDRFMLLKLVVILLLLRNTEMGLKHLRQTTYGLQLQNFIPHFTSRMEQHFTVILWVRLWKLNRLSIF